MPDVILCLGTCACNLPKPALCLGGCQTGGPTRPCRLVLRLGTPRTTEPPSQSLAGLTRLHKLHLDDLGIHSSLLAALPQSLCSLAVTNGYIHTGGVSSSLQHLTGLTSLRLTASVSADVNDYFRLPLASLTALEVLRLDRCGLREVPEQLPLMKSLKVQQGCSGS